MKNQETPNGMKGGSKEGLQAFDLRLGDCLEVMKSITDNSVDMVLADLP